MHFTHLVKWSMDKRGGDAQTHCQYRMDQSQECLVPWGQLIQLVQLAELELSIIVTQNLTDFHLEINFLYGTICPFITKSISCTRRALPSAPVPLLQHLFPSVSLCWPDLKSTWSVLTSRCPVQRTTQILREERFTHSSRPMYQINHTI